ncbi:cyclic nucleotide-gated cation channel (Abnormal chemotaxis protein4), partial [Trichinella spiralis]
MFDEKEKQQLRMVLTNAQDPRLISEEGEGVVELRCGSRDDTDDNVNPSTTTTTFDRQSTQL